MPHSGGGGFSGGGFHGGSNLASHVIANTSYVRHFSRTPFAGARAYVYYMGVVPHIIYSDQDPTKRKPTLVLPLILLFLFSIGELFVMTIASSHSPKKNLAQHDTEIVLKDETNVITDEEETRLKELFAEFHEKTGVMPSLATTVDSSWRYSYGSLTEYSLELYTRQWPIDESHWLIVYSSLSGADKKSWSYEIAQGYDSDDILYDGMKNRYFHPVVCDGLDGDLSVGESFIKGFETLIPELMKKDFYVDTEMIAFTVFWQFIVVALVIVAVDNYRKDKAIKKAEAVPEGVSIELKKCPKCGASYYKGTTDHCHKCGRSFLDDEFEGL